MKNLKFDNKEYQLVQSWNEMTGKQFVRTCHIRGKHINDSTQEAFNASRIILFSILSNVPQNLINEITAVQWVDILPHLNFVFETPDLDHNPLKKISTGIFHNVIGPVGMLEHSTYEEMITADTFFTKASTTKDIEFLYRLFAVLYRPERLNLKSVQCNPEIWNGDTREPFNSTLAKTRAKQYQESVPFHYVVGVFLYYWSFREHVLVKQFKNLFIKPQSSGQQVVRQGNDYGWAGQLLEMSGKQFGDLKETGNTHWSTILMEQSRQIDIARNRESKKQTA